MKLKDLKICIESGSQDRAVQELLFALGYAWSSTGRKFQPMPARYRNYYEGEYIYFLYADRYGNIRRNNDHRYFDQDPSEEVSLNALQRMCGINFSEYKHDNTKEKDYDQWGSW